MHKIKSTLRATCLVAVIFSLFIPFMKEAYAHPYSASYTTLTLTKSETKMTYALDEMSVIELTNPDLVYKGMMEQEEFDVVKDRYLEVLQDHIILKIDGEPQPWIEIESLTLNRKGDATKVYIDVIYPPISDTQSISLKDDLYLGDSVTNYANLLTINYGEQISTAALSGKNRTWALQMSEEDYNALKQDGQSSQNLGHLEEADSDVVGKEKQTAGWFSFFRMGIDHILGGYDHILFLLSLLVARQTFKQYAAVITSFTIAHSLTLTLSVLGWISLSPAIVEPIIALSICYVAVDNIVRKNVSHRWILTFFFGLIHGMGFADILLEMDIPKNQLAVVLASFNIGIEVVQLAIVILLLPLLGLLYRWKYSRRIIVTGSAIALILGTIWLVERTMT